MRLCVISNLYPPYARGGAERIAEIMARGLFDLGHDVAIISTKPSAGLKVEKAERYRIYRFKPMNLFYYLDDFRYSILRRFFWRIFDIFNLHSAFVVACVLRKEQPDIVVTHNLIGISFLVPFVIRALRIKHCHVLHDVQLSAASGIILKGKENSFLVNSWLTWIYEFICKILFKSPAIVVSPSRWLMDFYVSKGFFRKSTRIVQPNPIKTVNIAGGGRNERSNRFLFVGQLKPHKGIDWLLNVWQKNKIANELIVVGDGKHQINYDKIKYVGASAESGLNKIFVQCDFLIVPSICYENSPSVIQLAFANGVPVIVADIGGAAELVENGKSGFVFEAGSEMDFLKALKQAQSSPPEKRKQVSDYCRERAKTFSVNNYIKKLIEQCGTSR